MISVMARGGALPTLYGRLLKLFCAVMMKAFFCRLDHVDADRRQNLGPEKDEEKYQDCKLILSDTCEYSVHGYDRFKCRAESNGLTKWLSDNDLEIDKNRET